MVGKTGKREFTPMMQQYFKVKEQYPDCILFYRLGDFYEMFFDDALIASKVLELTLTGRDCGQEERAPMCGVPFHSCDGYIAKLISEGYKVAICEQMEDPATAKGLVKRDVIQIITPGTASKENMLRSDENNYLGAIHQSGDTMGVAFVDFSTGEFYASDVGAQQSYEAELSRFEPKEILLSPALKDGQVLGKTAREKFGCYITDGEDYFEKEKALSAIQRQFGEAGAGLDLERPSAAAVGALLGYVAHTQKTDMAHITGVTYYTAKEFMDIDMATKRNLELTETMRSKAKRGSLLWVLDKTQTAMGARMMRKWVEQPLIHPVQISRRLDGVEELVKNISLRDDAAAALASIRDMERLIGRLVAKTGNARDILSLGQSLCSLPKAMQVLSQMSSPIMRGLREKFDLLEDVASLISRSIVDEPPIAVKDGGMIREGYDEKLDHLRSGARDGKAWIAKIEQTEREKTGIKNLKVGFNRVFGYYIEVSKSNVSKVPEGYIRKQTLTNGERYITEELKKVEDLVLGAEEKIIALEYELFCSIRDQVAQAHERIQRTARVIATLDCLVSFAQVAVRQGYCKPQVGAGDAIVIKDGRHPVVERFSQEPFVPNDTKLNGTTDRLAIITGPNMAGKSTYMRQVALIVLMAQIGSYVPAAQAQIGVVDKIFTRVGASDDLAAGQSTFMVEMSEVAHILKNATKNSLIIYDEIGRGTSTYDGLAIAWSVLEYTLNPKYCGAKTLFATHYHELTALEQSLEGIKNYSVAVKERGEDIIFLRKIVSGGTSDSYGVDVARLAGVPGRVIKRAREILQYLEKEDKGQQELPVKQEKQRGGSGQLGFGSLEAEEIVNKIKALTVETLTPIEALNQLFELKQEADKL